MRIVAFEVDGARRLGVVVGDEVVDLREADPAAPVELRDWLAAYDGDLGPLAELAASAPARAVRPLDGLDHALPVAAPGKVVCLGLNYLEHVQEGPMRDNVPRFPTIFLRAATSLVPHQRPIIRPLASETLDYEAELAVVIGRRARHLSVADALSCVAGYSCFNDGSVREYQRRTSQWDIGKNFDRTGGFGPWLVTPDELPAGARGLKISSRLNGEVMQSDNTDNMMFPIAETIADVTRAMTLEPGDVLVTGTPSGVGHARRPPVWMRHGDVCEIEVEGVGVLRNPVRDEEPAAG
ncbi:fumarylacetoacetate hydrolase family protein [Plantactinospora sp. CA-290183]|uniref:fumarylacetoacetate hydrolase family protein n=1 Tax=Plantactinospora sp. CA-290183 TaxID=3240006 RepID=UPI003D8CF87F